MFFDAFVGILQRPFNATQMCQPCFSKNVIAIIVNINNNNNNNNNNKIIVITSNRIHKHRCPLVRQFPSLALLKSQSLIVVPLAIICQSAILKKNI
jgi:hypothetical protein